MQTNFVQTQESFSSPAHFWWRAITALIKNHLAELFLLERCPLSSHPRSANHPKKYRNSDFGTRAFNRSSSFHWIANLFNPFLALNNFEGSLSRIPMKTMNPYWFLRAAEFTEKLVRKSFTFQCTSSLRPRAMGALCEWNQNKSDWAVLHRAEANPDLCNSLYIDKVHSVRAFLHIMWHCYGFVIVASLSLSPN